MNVENLKVDIDISADFEGCKITLTNTHGGDVIYKITQFVSTSCSNSWEAVEGSAKAYILKGFQKTEEHKEMIAIIEDATKKYGY